jgi:hypothetical protein
MYEEESQKIRGKFSILRKGVQKVGISQRDPAKISSAKLCLLLHERSVLIMTMFNMLTEANIAHIIAGPCSTVVIRQADDGS